NMGFGKTERFRHTSLGQNFRLSNVQAAIGCAQIERLDACLVRKCEMAKIYRDVLADVECDELVVDPPFGKRTHSSIERTKVHDGIPRATSIGYAYWTPDDVIEFCKSWSPRVRGWFCALTSHDLVPVWESCLEDLGRYVFAPLACTQPGRNVRLNGDGPANWTDWLMVARPRSEEFSKWGALPGAYRVSNGRGAKSGSGIIGTKPIALMSAIIRDYTRPGDLVCDPCAGMATTAIACESLGRRFVGAEIDPETHAKAIKRIANGVQLDMFGAI
ncbi:MAG: DegT/DnrJ/EryC1/StrS family aminotransferase, partial [Proteobacteria bacterium]|nr:DegT/DnrJ/EryC1/StrS family aminotransferase [Pseudomonadota bacterium]